MRIALAVICVTHVIKLSLEAWSDLYSGLSAFFGEVNGVIHQAERQYGLANCNMTEYIIERLQYSIKH